ncbi:MAG: pYEATS domain-containing protein [Candidatus Binataceae bacterium]
MKRNLGIAVISGLVLLSTVLAIPTDRLTTPVVTLLTSLVWPYVLLIGLMLFQPQIKDLLSELGLQLNKGLRVKVPGGIEIETNLDTYARRIPAPGDGTQVKLENIALLHTSFFSPEATKRFNDGRDYYQFEVVVIAPELVMDRITSVTYNLENAWPENLRTRKITDRTSRFKMKELANGTSIVCATVRLEDQPEPLQLNRFIDLRRDGQRL